MNIPKGYKLVPVETLKFALGLTRHGFKNRTDQEADKYAALKTIAELLDSSTPPQPIYDEAKERELFESKFPVLAGILWDEDRKQYYGHSLYWLQQAQLDVWLACAQSRAKSVELGDE